MTSRALMVKDASGPKLLHNNTWGKYYRGN